MKRKQYHHLIVGIISLLILVACGTSTPPAETPTPTPNEEPNVLKVGLLAPLTGPSQTTGKDIRNAAIMAFEEVGYQVGRYTIELVEINSESNPEQAAQAYEKAILENGIQVGILNWHSSVSVSVMDVSAEYKIPHFFGLGASELINRKFRSNPEKYNYWNFKGWPTADKISQNYVGVLEGAIDDGLWQPANKLAALVVEDTDWGRSFALSMNEQLEDVDWEVIPTNYVAHDATDISSVLRKFRTKPVSLFITTGTSPEFMTSLIEQVAELELPSVVVADGFGWTGNRVDLTDNASDCVLDQIPVWRTEEFATKFENRWQNVPSPSSAGLSYDYTRFFIEILQATEEEYGELTSQTLYQFGQEKVQTGQFTYKNGVVMEEYKYTMETVPDPVVNENHYIFPVIQYFDGERVIIWPPSQQEAVFRPAPCTP